MKSGFGNSKGQTSSLNPRAKPLKRPSQARAVFTVEAIYEAFVRIWRRDGWSRLTTREVALEAGVAVGTLYDYFPSKEALISGYVRHCMEGLLQRLETEVVQAHDLDWRARIRHLITLTCAPDEIRLPLFSPAVQAIEHQFTEAKHHRRVYDELSQKWHAVFAACLDLPERPADTTIDAWVIMAWGGRRYCATAQPAAQAQTAWLSEMETMICGRLAGTL
ncbi:TetR/AcrR family transcriptional regulator [Pseudomonas vancouverensis]|uniref:TetR/AcrR family transcriptional regulator n=1 Tax=Pseudomonas vancouverensis TaxID=95300 RepID=A0A1H2NK69_PSEVA|nr:TetR/AcrR family transcriptional regulator [Pseudomonas vancouverensis]KAB0495170.1 TetR/AcrR family transcriptional regulator [Pseudomonas vancouverensis]TDB57069.1 TetR/AcrR family transcriptional regulator [Pseudomonas vancouverensis]SDV05869.1 transcriptional regulator, TetR family [Pseudomonas vancouverensis]